MSNLRILGLIIGIFGLFLTFRIYRGPRWKRLNFIFFGLISVFLIIVSINPNSINILAGMLALEKEHFGRILALLVFSCIILWYLGLYLKTKLDDYRHQFDDLVRKLGDEEAKATFNEDMAQKGKRNILIVMPAYNEAPNLKELLHSVPDVIGDKKTGVIVVDDGSTDDTAQIVKDAGDFIVKNKTHRGGGATLRLGYDIAKHFEPDIIVTMDADGQHSPLEIENLIRPIFENKFDFVIGSRILGKVEKDSVIRSVGLRVFNFIISTLLGTKITDCSSGFRAFKSGLLNKITLVEDQYHTSELIIEAVKKGFRIGEVPVRISKRKFGQSKKGRDLKYGLNFAKTILKTWWR